MKISKILKFTLLSILVVLVLFFWKNIINFVISTNLEISQKNLLGLTVIYWLEFLFLLLIYDLVIIGISSGINNYLLKLGKFEVRMKKVRIALYTIRLKYYLLRLSRLLRLGWLSYGTSKDSSVWISLSKPPLYKMILSIFRIVLSIPMLFAFLSACHSLQIFGMDYSYYLSKFQELFKEIVHIKVSISDIFLRIPTLVALVTLVPTIFFFYFYSQKRDIRKIIDKKNSKYFEDVVFLYERLLHWIDHHIYEISQNFEYVINYQDLIVEVFLKKEVPNYLSLTTERYNRPREVDELKFIEISDLDELEEIITKLSSNKLNKFTRIFSVKRFDIWYLYFWYFDLLKDKRKINSAFYTKQGMRDKLDHLSTYSCDITQEEFDEKREDTRAWLAWSIYNDLELLYALKRASNSLNAYLYSSKTERIILKALNKNK